MVDNECNAVNEFINARVNFAIHKLEDINPRYHEVCKNQETAWQSIDLILQKLEKDERRAVITYYEEEVHKFGFESNESYLQGIKDCFSVLSFFGVLGGRCSQSPSKV